MNKYSRNIVLIALSLIAALVVSCDKNGDKVTTLSFDEYESDYGELAEKYSEMNFETCADALAAGNEIVSVYYATADKAFSDNDAKAKSDLEHFGELLKAYDGAVESLWKKCPEEFDKWEKDNRKKIESISQRVNAMSEHYEVDTTFEDVSSEIEAVNEQVEQLKIDMQRFAEEDDSVNNK